MANETNAFSKINQVPGFNPMDHAKLLPDAFGESSLHLDVKRRVAWFRLKYPDGRISKHVVSITDGAAIMEARVYKNANDSEYDYLANGFGQRAFEADNPFGTRYIETAETAAVGRALSAAGFDIFDIGDSDGNEGAGQVDAPLKIPESASSHTDPNESEEQETVPTIGAPQSATTSTPATPEPVQQRTVEEIIKSMTLDDAKAYKVHFGNYKGKSLAQVAMENPSNVEWIANVYKVTGEKADILRAAARKIIEAAQKMAG